MPVILLALQACSTPEEARAYQVQAEYQQRQAAQQRQQSLASTCSSYGYRPGTDAMARCMEQADQRNRQSSAKDACLKNAGEAMCYFGCIGDKVNGMACNHRCKEREQANVAACNGVYLPPPTQQIYIQPGSGDVNPFPNMNKCIKDGGTLMCR